MPGTESLKHNKLVIVIMGCGRVGGKLASMFDAAGHKVTVLDIDGYSFRRLPPTFSGTALIGNGTDRPNTFSGMRMREIPVRSWTAVS